MYLIGLIHPLFLLYINYIDVLETNRSKTHCKTMYSSSLHILQSNITTLFTFFTCSLCRQSDSKPSLCLQSEQVMSYYRVICVMAMVLHPFATSYYPVITLLAMLKTIGIEGCVQDWTLQTLPFCLQNEYHTL